MKCETPHQAMNSHTPKERQGSMTITLLGTIVVVGLTIAGVKTINRHKPEAQRQEIAPTVLSVQTLPLSLGPHRLRIEGTGEVKAFRTVELKPEVTGLIIEVNPALELGAIVEAGEVLYKIDPRDATYVAQKSKAELENAKLKLKEELGRQTLAQQEWQSLQLAHGSSLEKELSLREPHLAKAKADVEAAEANYAMALLNIERCTLRAPFKGSIMAISSHKGSRVSSQDRLCQILDSSRLDFHCQLRQDQLRWISKTTPTLVQLELGPQQFLTGTLKHILPELSPSGRMATVIVELSTSEQPRPTELLVSRFLKAHFESDPIPNSVIVPRHAIHAENIVWLLTGEGTLAFQAVQWLPYGPDQALVLEGLKTQQQLIVSEISTPIEGMKCEIRHANIKND